MFKGKENHLELIRELRKVHALQSEEQEVQKAEKERTMTLKKQRDQQMQQVKYIRSHNLYKLTTDPTALAFFPSIGRAGGSTSGRTDRCGPSTAVRHFVQGACPPPGGAQDPRFHSAGWERPPSAGGGGERAASGGGAQTQRERRDL